MENRLYYICRVRLDGDDKFVIWFQNKRDGFVFADDGRLIWARTPEGIAKAAHERDITLVAEDATSYDFDRISDWCQRGRRRGRSRRRAADGVDCNAFLNAWNFFDDLAGVHEFPDTDFARLSCAADNCYDTLFWGCNLPVVTPPGEHFVPSWDHQRLDVIAEVMEVGLALLREKLRAA
jgi:hypothetical protein